MKRRVKKKLITLLILLILLFVSWYLENYNNKKNEINKRVNVPTNSNLTIYYLDVGQADSILLSDNGHYMLIDAGNEADGYKLVNFFKTLGIKSFDYVIGTHGHEDHIGGMDKIIDNFNIKHYYMPNVLVSSKNFEEVLDSLNRKRIKLETPNINQEFSLSNTKCKILYIGNDNEDINSNSIINRCVYYNTSFIFTGDATNACEKKILDQDIKSDVLKLGHHGSQYSSSNEFLQKVQPKYGIISVGRDNIYGHPKKVTMNKMRYYNIEVYRTDLNGTIVVNSDGNNIKISTMESDVNG
ncbi:MAG: MBL fold metallo-hydrolase [Bacilli bacterium]|nr:MBL fold metallo-hydrolase [Bacilli bacterium]